MLRKLVPVAIALVLVASCGGDDDDDGTSGNPGTRPPKTTTTTDTPASDGDDEHVSDADYADAFAQSLQDTEAGFGVTAAEAQCATDRIMEEIGAERLQDAGMTTDALASPGSGPTDLTEDEAGAMFDAVRECADLGTALGRTLTGDSTISAEEAQCFSDAVADDDVVRRITVQSLRSGDDATPDRPDAEHIVDLMLDCFDFGAFFVSAIEESGITVTDEQRACLREEIAQSESYRDAIVSEILGETVPEDESATMFSDIALVCVPELAVPDTGTGAG